MPNKFDNKKESPNSLNLSKEKEPESKILSSKKVFSVVFIVCLAAIILGFFRLGSLIKSPFAPSSNSSNLNLDLLNTSQIATLAELQNKDTDSDGLSDYDELYVYNTSPYLADSDSDGFSDKEEIDSGNDPNCPAGEDCTGQTGTVNSNLNSNTNTNNSLSNTNSSLSNTSSSLATGDISAAQLRETLKNAGAPEDVLNATDDATLMQFYQQALQEQNTNLNINSQTVNLNTNSQTTNLNTNNAVNLNINASLLNLESLQNLSASEIRDLLVASGVDSGTLSSLDDATLKAIFSQAISEISTE